MQHMKCSIRHRHGRRLQRAFEFRQGGGALQRCWESKQWFIHAPPVAALPQNRTALRQNFLDRRERGFGVCCAPVKDLIKLVKTYRVTAGLADRLRLAEDIFRVIQPELWHFVLASIQPPAAEDVFREVQKAVATGLRKFTGSTEPEF